MVSDPDQDLTVPSAAAMWLSRMQRPDADEFRTEFQRWLSADAAHLAAYNKAAARFHDARLLSQSEIWKAREAQPSRRRMAGSNLAWAILLALLAGGLFWLVLPTVSQKSAKKGLSLPAGAAPEVALIGNPGRKISNNRLADGSNATLDVGGKLRVALDHTARHIWLETGRARFSVVHDGRPFIVHARGGTITATGTLFDVELMPDDSVCVTLMEGGVDVRSIANDPTHVRALKPGEMLNFAAARPSLAVGVASRQDRAWPDGIAEFDGAPLSLVVAQANRYGQIPIRLAGDRLAATQISGRFRIDDSVRLAANLSRTLDLVVERREGAIILRE